MNCEICATKFKRVKDLIRHGTSHKHAHFFCISCVMPFYSVTGVIHHIASKEHNITALASGVYFDVTDNCPDDIFRPSFPSHNCCLLCSSRDGTADNFHLKSDTHKYMAWLLRTIIESKKILCTDIHATQNTQAFISKIINVKEKRFHAHQHVRGSLPFVCELCNLHFMKPEYYEQHLRDQSHIRMEKFLIKLSHMMKKVGIIGAGYYTYIGKTFSNALRPLFYCEVCYMWIDTPFNYIQHRKSNKHKNVERMNKLSVKREICDIDLHDTVSARLTHHCSNIKYEKYRQLLVREEYKKSEKYSPKVMNVNGDYDGKDDSKYLLGGAATDSARMTHYYPKLKSEKYKRHSVSVGHRKFEESISEAGDVDSDCEYIGEKPCKMLKTSPSFLKYSDGKHQKISDRMKVMLNKEDQIPRFRACETITTEPPPLDFEVAETESHFPQCEIETSGASSSLTPIPLQVAETRSHLPQHGFQASGTSQNSLSLDSEVVIPKSNLPQPEFEIVETSRNSLLAVEVTETESHFLQREIETDDVSSSLTPFPLQVTETRSHLPQQGFQADGTSQNSPPLDSEGAAPKNNLLQHEFEIIETSRNSPLVVEVTETIINKQQQEIEADETSQNSRLDPQIEGAKEGLPPSGFDVGGTSRISPTLDIEVKSNFKRCGLKTNVTSGNSSPHPESEDSEMKVHPPHLDFEDRNAIVDSDQEHYCELCDFLSYNSLHYGKHLLGEQHKRMRRLINKKGKSMCVDKQVLETSTSAHPLQYNCELCDVFNRDSREYEHHLYSVTHRKNQWLLYVLKQRPL